MVKVNRLHTKLFSLLDKQTYQTLNLKADEYPDMRYEQNQVWYQASLNKYQPHLKYLNELKQKPLFRRNSQPNAHINEQSIEISQRIRSSSSNIIDIKETDHEGYIYIITDESLDEIKIGRSCTKNNQNRINEQIEHFTNPVWHKFKTPFNKAIEKFIHQKLSGYRLEPVDHYPAGKSEWFNLSYLSYEMIKELIKEICDTSQTLKGPWDKYVLQHKSDIPKLAENLYFSDFNFQNLNMTLSSHQKIQGQIDALRRNLTESEITKVIDYIKEKELHVRGSKTRREPVPTPRTVSTPKINDGGCTATTLAGTRCSRGAQYGSLCWQHEDVRRMDAREYVSDRCQATTRRGTQCRRRGPHVIRNGGYCWQH